MSWEDDLIRARRDLSAERKQMKTELYKTEMCRSFLEQGECRYGDKCQFAHGYQELRQVNRHPKYRTKKCKSFEESGTCSYGVRCRFIHDRGNGPQLNTNMMLRMNGCELSRFRLPVFQHLQENRA